MPELKREEIERYLSSVFGARVNVLNLVTLGSGSSGTDIKAYGYGTPVRVDYCVAGQQPKIAVLHTMTPGPFGHEHMADRAEELIVARIKPSIIFRVTSGRWTYAGFDQAAV